MVEGASVAGAQLRLIVDPLEELRRSIQRLLWDLVEQSGLLAEQVRRRPQVREMPEALLIEVGLHPLGDPGITGPEVGLRDLLRQVARVRAVDELQVEVGLEPVLDIGGRRTCELTDLHEIVLAEVPGLLQVLDALPVVAAARVDEHRRDDDAISDIAQDKGGGVQNIPFVTENANASFIGAIFWIESVDGSNDTFLQLQYVQTVLVDFKGLRWPHVSAATLLKTF